MTFAQIRKLYAPDDDPAPTEPPPTDPPVDPPTNTPPVDPPKDPPADWRTAMAGGDEKFLKQLERFTTPEAFAKSYKSAQAKIAEGLKPPEFPAKGTDDEKKAWREANGVPAEVTAYLDNVGDGIVIGETDKPIFEDFAKYAQESNMTQTQFDAAAKWYSAWAEQQQTEFVEHNAQRERETLDALTAEYGGHQVLKMHQNNVASFLENFFGKEGAELLQKATVNNEFVLGDKGVLKGLIEAANSWTPATVPRGGGNDPGASVDARLAELGAMRKKDYNGYMKNEKLVKEERELLEAKERLGKR